MDSLYADRPARSVWCKPTNEGEAMSTPGDHPHNQMTAAEAVERARQLLQQALSADDDPVGSEMREFRQKFATYEED